MALESTNVSSLVSTIYDETVDMIEETTDYLVARAKRDRRAMPAAALAAFAGESIRLTTRLTQVMAWLLNQRAVQSGELTIPQSRTPDRRLGNIRVCLGQSFTGAHLLPLKLQDMMERSEDLFRRVLKLDRLLSAAPSDNPVHDLLRGLGHDLTRAKPIRGT